MKTRTSPEDVFVGVRINKSVDERICASDKTKSDFIRCAIERYLISLAELEIV